MKEPFNDISDIGRIRGGCGVFNSCRLMEIN